MFFYRHLHSLVCASHRAWVDKVPQSKRIFPQKSALLPRGIHHLQLRLKLLQALSSLSLIHEVLSIQLFMGILGVACVPGSQKGCFLHSSGFKNEQSPPFQLHNSVLLSHTQFTSSISVQPLFSDLPPHLSYLSIQPPPLWLAG